MLKVGYAETDITPSVPTELVGYNRKDAMSKGVLSPLMAQISVWEGEERCCLITVDSLGFIKELADTLRRKVGQILQITTDKVMLCFSHCHSAPNAAAHPEYFEMLCKNILSAAEKALQSMQAVRVGCMNAEVDIGVNRREENTKVDKRAGIVKVCEGEDNIKLLLVRVTAHCNVLKRDNLHISPDYFGCIRELLKKEYHCPVMVVQGPAGNVAPKYFDSAKTPIDAKGAEYVRSKNALWEMAEAVLEKIKGVKTLRTTDTDCLRMYSAEMILRAPVPSDAKAEEIAAKAKAECGIDGTMWLAEIRKLHEKGIRWQEEKIEVQYFSIDQVLFCGVPFELMTEIALDAEEKTKNTFFYGNGYTNGCSTYFATAEEYDRGGYEVYYAMLLYYTYYNRVFPFEREAAEKLVAFMLSHAPKDSVL